jgi:hypothetical protein
LRKTGIQDWISARTLQAQDSPTRTEWITAGAKPAGEEGVYFVGITDYAQGELGDIVFVELPEVGRHIGAAEEAAVIDGASRWTILWRIFVPLSMPAIATLSTFMFLYAWNSFIWPFIVIGAGNQDNHVLTVSLQQLGGRAAETPNLVLAGVMIAIAVPVTVFVLAQRYFVENVATSGIK